MLLSIILYLVSFITIWYGSGLIISSVDLLSHRIRISRFLLSFFLLGLLTSIPEIAVGLTSVIEQKPEIFVGNLLGGVPVLFLFVTPLLAVLGNGVKIDHGFVHWKLIATLGVILAPSVFVLDASVSNIEALSMIFMYSGLIFILRNHISTKKNTRKKSKQVINVFKIVLSIVIGTVLVFISSHIIVDKTIQLARILNVSSFYISLIGISLGTNLPELSLAVRAILQKKKDIALGDYLGSAAANTLLFGIFSLLIDGNSYHVQHYLLEFSVLVVGLLLFYFFIQSKDDISRKEGFILLCFFLVFCVLGIR